MRPLIPAFLPLSSTHHPLLLLAHRFGRRRGRPMLARLCAAAALVGALPGCGSIHIPVSATRLAYPPLVERLPVKVGVFYGPDFQQYEYISEPKSANQVIYRVFTLEHLGPASLEIFTQVFAAMFDQAVPISSLAETPPGLDGILEVQFEGVSLEYYTGTIGFAVTYRVLLRAPGNGAACATWSLTGNSHAVVVHVFQLEHKGRRAAAGAVRSAAAEFSLHFTEQAGVRQWLAKRGVTVEGTEAGW